MLREEGFVVAREGEIALVSSQRKKACGHCSGDASCATLSFGGGNREVHFRALNSIDAEVGERVRLEIPESVFLKASSLLYGAPVLALLLVGGLVREILLGFGLADAAEGFGALAGLAALAGSFFLLRIYNSRIENDPHHLPVITASYAASVSPVSFISPAGAVKPSGDEASGGGVIS